MKKIFPVENLTIKNLLKDLTLCLWYKHIQMSLNEIHMEPFIFPMWDKLCFIELNWTKTASAWMSSDRPCQRNLMKYRKYHMDHGLWGQTALSHPEFDQNLWEVPRKWTLRSCRAASSVPNSKWNHWQTLVSLCVTLSGCWCWMIQHIQHVSQNAAHSCPTLPFCQKTDTHPSRPLRTGHCRDAWWAAATPAGSPTRLWFWRTGRSDGACLCGTARSVGSTAPRPWLDQALQFEF